MATNGIRKVQHYDNILEALQRALPGHPHVAGGAVRDTLLERQIHDIDIFVRADASDKAAVGATKSINFWSSVRGRVMTELTSIDRLFAPYPPSMKFVGEKRRIKKFRGGATTIDRAYVEGWVKCLMGHRPLPTTALLYKRNMIETLLAVQPNKYALEAALWHFIDDHLLPSPDIVLAWCARPIPEDERWVNVAYTAACIAGMNPNEVTGFLKILHERSFYDVPDHEGPSRDGTIAAAAGAVKMLLHVLIENHDDPDKMRKLRDARNAAMERVFGPAIYVPNDDGGGDAA